MGYGNGYAPAQGAATDDGAKVTGVSPASATSGDTLTLAGSGLTGATAVKFGASLMAAASFSVVNDETITAVLPSLPDSSGLLPVEVTVPLEQVDAFDWVKPPDPWTPAEISTDLWLRADAGVTESGGSVSLWADQSGAGRDFSQSSASQQPDLGATSFNSAHPGVSFTGSSHYLKSTISGSPTANRTYFFAIDVVSYGNWRMLFDAGTNEVWNAYSTTGWRWGASGSSGQKPTGAGIISLGLEDDGEMFLNGTAIYSPTFTQAALSLDGSPAGLGAKGSGSSKVSDVVLAEVFFTSAPASVATRQLCEGYLAWKYGLEGDLPADHPWKAAAPTV